jgi:hypothetical protein
VAHWFEAGEAPARELARELGALGVLGMHLIGYGCARASATAYGLACLELEAGDSGVRSLVSVNLFGGSCMITIKTVKVFGVDTRVPRGLVLNPHG